MPSLVGSEMCIRDRDTISINDKDIPKIVSLLEGVFVEQDYFIRKDYFSVVYPRMFKRYFAYQLMKDNLPNNEFIESIKLDFEELKTRINKWIDQGLEDDILSRFFEIKTFHNKDEYEKIIKTIFYLANQKSKESATNYSNDRINYNGYDLIGKLDKNNGFINLYKDHGGSKKFDEFINSLFANLNFPNLFESNFIGFIIRGGFDFSISKEKLLEYAVRYLNDYCDSAKKLDKVIWDLAYNCRSTKSIEGDKIDFIYTCLLYTSDAADDMQCVDLGGRRIIKKKKKKQRVSKMKCEKDIND
eukprot:TRINITY_DN1347_c0_g1_i2.p1 TRINITY_DN1347_c0_g1~~TRINITY_DN1347_c0_g1_i2.p1  ORF type:complete len:301 (-),score=57.35 TRINITY_DN1347_c0_g1_i2:76-978(-)